MLYLCITSSITVKKVSLNRLLSDTFLYRFFNINFYLEVPYSIVFVSIPIYCSFPQDTDDSSSDTTYILFLPHMLRLNFGWPVLFHSVPAH